MVQMYVCIDGGRCRRAATVYVLNISIQHMYTHDTQDTPGPDDLRRAGHRLEAMDVKAVSDQDI
jgi:hypothetical protein